MELPEIITRPVQMFREAFDLEKDIDSPGLAVQLVELKEQLTQLRGLLDEARDLSEQKDAVIAQLQAAMAAKGEMVLEGSAYFARQGDKTVDGPFCTCCFDRDGRRVRLVPGAKPQGAPGRQSEWVQCPHCRTPFRSRQASEQRTGQKAKAARGSVTKKDKTSRPKGRSTPSRSRRGSKAKNR
jgi:hypothetical protein